MNRRHFFKLASGGVLMAAIPGTGQGAAQNKAPIPGALGMLYDSTLCIGCQACVSKCQQVNHSDGRPHGGPYAGGEANWSNNDKLSPYTNNIIQVWSSGSGQHKDQTENGYAYIKKQCMHCVDPNCVSVCPVTALQKHPVTGVVHYDPSVCIGCRYCMVACPFDVPKYDYDSPVGKIHKCELCNQQGLGRLDRGELPGCVEVCPTGAVIFGTRQDLLGEAKRRLGLKAGEVYRYPRQRLTDNDTYERQAARYNPHVYGELEGGGTQVLVLAGVPFAELDLPPLATLSTGERSEHLQHTLYRGMVIPLALLAGITTLVHRNMKKDPPDKENDHQNDA